MVGIRLRTGKDLELGWLSDRVINSHRQSEFLVDLMQDLSMHLLQLNEHSGAFLWHFSHWSAYNLVKDGAEIHDTGAQTPGLIFDRAQHIFLVE